jgi:hypothetical protein
MHKTLHTKRLADDPSPAAYVRGGSVVSNGDYERVNLVC